MESTITLPKDGDTRKRFISRFEGGKLYQLDFDGYHIRLIAKLIGVDIPLDIKAHKWLADQYGADLKDAKQLHSDSYTVGYRTNINTFHSSVRPQNM